MLLSPWTLIQVSPVNQHGFRCRFVRPILGVVPGHSNSLYPRKRDLLAASSRQPVNLNGPLSGVDYHPVSAIGSFVEQDHPLAGRAEPPPHATSFDSGLLVGPSGMFDVGDFAGCDGLASGVPSGDPRDDEGCNRQYEGGDSHLGNSTRE